MQHFFLHFCFSYYSAFAWLMQGFDLGLIRISKGETILMPLLLSLPLPQTEEEITKRGLPDLES